MKMNEIQSYSKISLLFGIMLLLVPGVLLAQAEVTYLEGDVEIVRSGLSEFADFGTEILPNDLIVTGPDALVIVSFQRYGEIKLNSNSSFFVDRFDRQFQGNLESGGVFARVDPLNGRNFNIRANNATAGVRGTQFFVAFGRLIDEEPDIWLCVNEGSVEVATTEDSDGVIVNEGEGINVLGGQDITDPRFYEWTQDLNWNTDPSAGGVRDDTDLDDIYSDLLDIDYD